MTNRYYYNNFDKDSTRKECHIQGCTKNGEFPAPKSRNMLRDYYWLCLEHIREYNASWDYFKNMDRNDIEEYKNNSLHGHRPSWGMGTNNNEQIVKINQALHDYFSLDDAPKLKLPDNIIESLHKLQLTYPITREKLQKQYKKLAKKHHPDVNNNCKFAEEKFKEIQKSYETLLNSDYIKEYDYD